MCACGLQGFLLSRPVTCGLIITVTLFRGCLWSCNVLARCVQKDNEGSLRGLVRQLSIDQFENEGRRVDPESSAKHAKTPFFERTSMDPGSTHKV